MICLYVCFDHFDIYPFIPECNREGNFFSFSSSFYLFCIAAQESLCTFSLSEYFYFI